MGNVPVIAIAGRLLTPSECVTVWAALCSFHMQLVEDGLGDDDHGTTMTRLHLGNLQSIFLQNPFDRLADK